MSQMTITAMRDKSFGAVVRGVSLAELGDDEFEAIGTALLSHSFLVFPEQFISDDEQAAFGSRFGELEFGAVALSNQAPSSQGTPGGIYDIETQRMRMMVGNEAWHSDSSYLPVSSKCAMLRAATVPEVGGETELADTRAAFEALDATMKVRIADLCAYHSY